MCTKLTVVLVEDMVEAEEATLLEEALTSLVLMPLQEEVQEEGTAVEAAVVSQAVLL